MNVSEKNFNDGDQKEIELLAKLIHKITQMRIQKYVREGLKIPFEEEVALDTIEQRRLDELVANKCLAEAERLMYVWIGLLKFIKAEHGLPKRRKLTDLFTIHGLPLPHEMLLQAAKVSEIIFLEDEDVQCIFSQMAESSLRGKVVMHVCNLLRLK